MRKTLRLQSLFSLESEDFDDEDFLSVLEDAEKSTPTEVKPGTRLLRPISRNLSQHQEDLHCSSLVPCSSVRRPGIAQKPPCDTHDVDDDELLSVCSELEEVPLELCQVQDSKGGKDIQVGPLTQKSSCTIQLRPTGNAHCQGTAARACLQGFPETQLGMSECFINRVSSPNAIQGHAVRGPSVHNAFPGPVAKRPCLRTITETLNQTPQKGPSTSQSSPYLQQHHMNQCATRKMPIGCTLQTGNDQARQHVSPIKHGQGTPQMSRMNMPSPHVMTPNSMQTPVVTNHLVQLVTAANQTPRRLSWDMPSTKERRFPGPAGLLPQQVSSRALEEILVSTPHTPNHGARAKVCSKEGVDSQQPVEEDFVRGPWATMKAELALDENDPNCFLRTYSVVMVLRKAALKQLQRNKVPRMAVALKSLNPANGDASAVFRDPTGEMQGTIHHLLLEERDSELKIGSVLLLKQVGVFSPSHRNHYLNVTPNNIVKIYPLVEEGSCTRVRQDPQVSEEKTDLNRNKSHSSPQPSSSTSQNRGLQMSGPGDWDMDDLDSLLCDLSEDPGD
ncbi:homologous recombination OB-fold protein [Pelodytes ibericus]